MACNDPCCVVTTGSDGLLGGGSQFDLMAEESGLDERVVLQRRERRSNSGMQRTYANDTGVLNVVDVLSVVVELSGVGDGVHVGWNC